MLLCDLRHKDTNAMRNTRGCLAEHGIVITLVGIRK